MNNTNIIKYKKNTQRQNNTITINNGNNEKNKHEKAKKE